MALVINAPEEVYSIENFHNKKLFIAGGISGCKNWQDILTDYLKNEPGLTIYNPRRNDFDLNNEKETEKQIVWEYEHLLKSDIISFWFTADTLCPITLYELGLHGIQEKTIIGIDPEYKRRIDIEIQSKLTRPSSPIVYSLKKLADEIIKKLNE